MVQVCFLKPFVQPDPLSLVFLVISSFHSFSEFQLLLLVSESKCQMKDDSIVHKADFSRSCQTLQNSPMHSFSTSFCEIWNDFPSFTISSRFRLYVKRSCDDRIPSLHWHYTRFVTTTDSSAPVMHILTFILAYMLARIFHFPLHDRILLFPFRACCHTPVTSTPAAVYPINRFPIDLSHRPHNTMVLTTPVSINDASSVLHFRSALWRITDRFYLPFLICSIPWLLATAPVSVLQPLPV